MSTSRWSNGCVWPISITAKASDLWAGTGPVIPMDMRRKVVTLDEADEVDIDIVFDPPWHPRMISDEAKQELGIDDDALDD